MHLRFLPVLRKRIRSDICSVGVSSSSQVCAALCRNISSSNKFFGENACTVKFSVAYCNPNFNRYAKKVAGNSSCSINVGDVWPYTPILRWRTIKLGDQFRLTAVLYISMPPFDFDNALKFLGMNKKVAYILLIIKHTEKKSDVSLLFWN